MAKKKRPVRRKHKLPDFGAEVVRFVAEREAAEAEAARLGAQWREKYMLEVEELIRYGEKRKHGWAVGQTGLFSPRTREEEAKAKALTGYVVTREEQMLNMFYGMADEVKRARELDYEVGRLER